MHSFARRLHGGAEPSPKTRTRGLILDQGARYDLTVWACDTFLFRGQVRGLRRQAVELARLQPGEHALDVGCGTGTLAIEAQRRVGATGRVVGVDPGERQITRAGSKTARRHLPTEFTVGVVESLPFHDQSFDVAFSTLMMHHLPKSLQREGLVEIARVLKPGGRLVVGDFTSKRDRQGRARGFHAGGSDMRELAALLREAGFSVVESRDVRPARFSSFPGASLLLAQKD